MRQRKKILKGFAGFCHNIMEQAEKEGGKVLEEQKAIREYLLGALSNKAEMRRIEEKILLDDDYVEKLSVAEDQLIDEYLDGTLAASEQKSFVQFFLTIPERKQKLRLIRDLRKYAANTENQTIRQFPKEKSGFFDWRRLISLPSFRLAAAVLLFLVVGLIGWRAIFYQSDIDKGFAQLQIAYRGQRPTESRSTANFDYAQLPNTRGNATQTITDQDAYRLASIYLLDAAKNPNDSEANHKAGLLYLADKNFDDALKKFNSAVEVTPNNSKIHNDIGTAYLEKAERAKLEEKNDEVIENRSLALKSINRALEIDDSLLEALFNKALVLQKMQHTNKAKQAWEEYLKKDSTSPWANEARENLEQLKEQTGKSKDNSQILQDFLDAFHNKNDAKAWEIASQTKELIEGVMIQQQLAQKFLEASQQSRREEADKILSAFVYLGELENQNAKDSYFAELADYYSKTNQTQQQKLVQARLEMQKGYELILDGKWSPALTAFEQAKDLFIHAGNNFEAQIAEYQICYCLCQQNKIKESTERLLVLSQFSAQKNYKWLQVLSEGWIGSNYALSGEYSKSINFSQKALKIATEISDIYDIQKTLNQLSHVYWLIGDTRKTLKSIHDSLDFSNLYYQSARQKTRNMAFATAGLYRFKLYAAAAAFGQEEIYVAQAENDDWFSHMAHTHLAMIFSEEQKYQEAFQAIETAFELSNSFTYETKRKQNTLTRLILANLQRETNNCKEAVNNYNQVIQDYENTEFIIRRYEARKGRLLCFAALKNDVAVREEMPVLLQIFDDNRQKITEESDRITFFDNEQNVYDIATDYSYTQLQNSEQAFNYAENSRARSLLGLMQNNQSKPLTLPEIRQRISPKAQIVYYALLADKILIWHISDTKLSVAVKPIKSDEINDKIQKYRKLLIADDDNHEIADLAKELHQLLIQPIESMLEPDKSLCIIADKILFHVPFAALVSSQTNKYLIEDYALFYAPSATIFINETEKAGQIDANLNETILSVGNPWFSRKEYPGLDDLPDAAREAQEIASLYNSPKILVTHKAVKEQIINNLSEADIFHFAGHYVANGKSASLSKFLLASGELSVDEIMQKKLSRTRLMILPACETGVEKFYNGEGMIGAARAFLASGVPLVVASQWSVDSKATSKLMIKFHRFRKLQKLSTIAALRRAQMEMLNDENPHFRHPIYWAGFLPIGGLANF